MAPQRPTYNDVLLLRDCKTKDFHSSRKTSSVLKTEAVLFLGPGSSVCIATAYGLDGPGIGSRWEERFSAHVQTGPEAHPASCTMGSGSFSRVRCGRDMTLTPHPLLELYLYSP